MSDEIKKDEVLEPVTQASWAVYTPDNVLSTDSVKPTETKGYINAETWKTIQQEEEVSDEAEEIEDTAQKAFQEWTGEFKDIPPEHQGVNQGNEVPNNGYDSSKPEQWAPATTEEVDPGAGADTNVATKTAEENQ